MLERRDQLPGVSSPTGRDERGENPPRPSARCEFGAQPAGGLTDVFACLRFGDTVITMCPTDSTTVIRGRYA